MAYLFEMMPTATQLVLLLGLDSLTENGNTAYQGVLNSTCLLNQWASTFSHLQNFSLAVPTCLLGHLCLLKTNLLICLLQIPKSTGIQDQRLKVFPLAVNKVDRGRGKLIPAPFL